jgi:hypothetical protein
MWTVATHGRFATFVRSSELPTKSSECLGMMKITTLHLVVAIAAALVIGFFVGKRQTAEGFQSACNVCRKTPCCCRPAGSGAGSGSQRPCPPCPEPDPSKWVLKATVPPCPPMPDMSKYMLKTECPPLPDMSKYVLKSSVPQCPPCISTCSKPCKIGECPPCPRPRCPIVKCPEPRACPACPEVRCAPCPEPNIRCNAAYEPSTPVRPMLASTNTFGF